MIELARAPHRNLLAIGTYDRYAPNATSAVWWGGHDIALIKIHVGFVARIIDKVLRLAGRDPLGRKVMLSLSPRHVSSFSASHGETQSDPSEEGVSCIYVRLFDGFLGIEISSLKAPNCLQ